MTVILAIVIINIVQEIAQGCEQVEILSCITGVQQEIATTKFYTSIEQLNSYCDKIATAHLCILHESQHCPKELRATYLKLVDAEKAVTKRLCRPGTFQDEYLEEANCISAVFSTPANGPCFDSYTELLAAVSQSNFSIRSPSGLQGMCCAYYAVHKCTQVHGGRCGRRSFNKSILRQIFQGLDHNCHSFENSCIHERSSLKSKSDPSDKQVHSSVQPVCSSRCSARIWLSVHVILVIRKVI